MQTPSTHSEDATSNELPRNCQSTWGLVAGASLISTGLAAYEIVPASVTPLIRDSLAVSPTIAGFLVGVMFGTAVIASLPVGAVLDRTDSRTAIALDVLTLFGRIGKPFRVCFPVSDRATRDHRLRS